MRILLSVLLLQIYCVEMNAQSVNCPLSGVFLTGMPSCAGDYYLAFEDNFDGNALDLIKWEVPAHGKLYNDPNCLSQEYNSIENVEVSNGTCKLIAKQETVTRRAESWRGDNEILADGLPNLRSFYYTSSLLRSNTENFLYGKYEIRCKMPSGSGFWPAFWTYGGASGRWNELDFVDNLDGNDTYACGPGHDFDGDGDSEGCRFSTNSVPDFTQWHTFTCTYDFDRIVWEIDGVVIRVLYRFTTASGASITCGDNISNGVYFQAESFPVEYMKIIVNLAVRNGNEAPSTSDLPGVMEIDYVRFYIKSIGEPCEGCVDHIVYDNSNQLPDLTRAEVFVQAGNNVTVENGQDVTFKSPSIVLLPGFSVDQGGNFIASAEECGLANLEDVPINLLGSNAIDNYIIDKCTNPLYAIHVTGVYSIYATVTNDLGQVIHIESSNPTANYVMLWDAVNAADGWYQIHLELSNCTQTDTRDYSVYVGTIGCRLINENDDTLSEMPSNEFQVYPNPANSTLNLSFSVNGFTQFHISIYDVHGREVWYEEAVEGEGPVIEHRIDVSTFLSGVYYVSTTSNDMVSQQRFVISR